MTQPSQPEMTPANSNGNVKTQTVVIVVASLMIFCSIAGVLVGVQYGNVMEEHLDIYIFRDPDPVKDVTKQFIDRDNPFLRLFGASSEIKQVTDYSTVFDTLKYARKKHPGQANSLDALCRRYKVNNSHRALHGALLDTQLLLEVYLAMTGEQMTLFDPAAEPLKDVKQAVAKVSAGERQPLTVIKATSTELQAHEAYLAALGAAKTRN